jgi:hypothetical protein
MVKRSQTEVGCIDSEYHLTSNMLMKGNCLQQWPSAFSMKLAFDSMEGDLIALECNATRNAKASQARLEEA